MPYIKLGNTGTEVSKISLGMMSFGKPYITHPVLGMMQVRTECSRPTLD